MNSLVEPSGTPTSGLAVLKHPGGLFSRRRFPCPVVRIDDCKMNYRLDVCAHVNHGCAQALVLMKLAIDITRRLDIALMVKRVEVSRRQLKQRRERRGIPP